MKNLKVSAKLIIGFMIIAVLTTAVGIIGIIGMQLISDELDDIYHHHTIPLPEFTRVVDMLQRQRSIMREFVIGTAVGDFELIRDARSRAESYQQTMSMSIERYRSSQAADEGRNLFEEAIALYNTEFRTALDRIFELSKTDIDPIVLYNSLTEYNEMTNRIVELLDRTMEVKMALSSQADSAADLTSRNFLIVIILVLVLAVTSAILIALYISGLISKPLKLLSTFMIAAGKTGNISISPEEEKRFEKMSLIKDEIGETIAGAVLFVDHVSMISEELEKIAEGDLSVEVTLLSEHDTMGSSMSTMLNNLNRMFQEIHTSTDQVSAGSKQVADGAQLLARGTTDQAASIQELSSAITEIASRTKNNAATAEKTAKLSNIIKENAEKGTRQMGDMIIAVKDINDASQSISKIIKTIDDIAFQTNILALNAAVEAARAGQHGKGFAVVAEEVRNLASKSAAAAKDTGNMIQNSMEKAGLGSRIAGETAESLREIVLGINETSGLISEIAFASDEQSSSIEHVNIGIEQVSNVVGQNSATAEQSAAASQELSSQSSMLERLIGQFKLKPFESPTFNLPIPPEPSFIDIQPQQSHNNSPFGKYGAY